MQKQYFFSEPKSSSSFLNLQSHLLTSREKIWQRHKSRNRTPLMILKLNFWVCTSKDNFTVFQLVALVL